MQRRLGYRGAAAAVILLGWLPAVTAFAADPGGRRIRRVAVVSPRPSRAVARGRAIGVSRGIQARSAIAVRTEAPQLLIESGSLDFGPVVPGNEAIQPGGVVARVISQGPYRLVLVSRGGVVTKDGQPVSGAGLSCRSSQTGAFHRLRVGAPVTVWSGGGTSPAGDLVVLDLKLDLTDLDPTGHYVYALDLRVEPAY